MTSDEIAKALASIGQHHTHAQRELLQLAVRLQNEGVTGQLPAAQVDVQPAQQREPDAAYEDVLPVVHATTASATTMPATVSTGAIRAAPTRAQALETAKEVLKEELGHRIQGSSQAHMLHLVDRVAQADVDARRQVEVSPTPVFEPVPAAGNAAANTAANVTGATGEESSVEFVRGWFNAQTVEGGRGPLGKGVYGLKHYEQDVRLVKQADLKAWPSGFYTDHRTRCLQFMINHADAGWAILVEGLSASDIRISTLQYSEAEFASFIPIAPARFDRDARVFLSAGFRQIFPL